MATSFEDKHLGILQNMEFMIIRVYRAHPDLMDFHVDKALESLLRFYQAEKKERPAPAFTFGPLDQQIYQDVGDVCQFHLGRPSSFTADMELLEPVTDEVTVEDVMACLKRIRQSISQWTKQSGRQGYLVFANQFQPK